MATFFVPHEDYFQFLLKLLMQKEKMRFLVSVKFLARFWTANVVDVTTIFVIIFIDLGSCYVGATFADVAT